MKTEINNKKTKIYIIQNSILKKHKLDSTIISNKVL